MMSSDAVIRVIEVRPAYLYLPAPNRDPLIVDGVTFVFDHA